MTSSSSVYFLLDKSGSMEKYKNDTIGGFNQFVNKQKTDNPGGKLSLLLFNDECHTVYTNVDIENVEILDGRSYDPCGTTALLDAIAKTIKMAEEEKPVAASADKIIVVILTDGEENSSRKYTKKQVNELIESKISATAAAWSFVFLGANQDAIKEAGAFGIPEHSAMTFAQDSTTAAFGNLSAAIGRQTSMASCSVVFTQTERESSLSF